MRWLILILVLLVGCQSSAPPPPKPKATYKVRLLFEHEGARVYAFEDDWRTHYYVVTSDTTTTTTTQTSGKTHYEENIPTQKGSPKP